MPRVKRPHTTYGIILYTSTGPRYDVKLDSGVILRSLKDVNDRRYGENQRVIVKMVNGQGEINGIASRGAPAKTTVTVSI